MSTENVQTDLTVNVQIELYYDLFVPETVAQPAQLIIAVHGYGAHKRHMMREARAIGSDKFVIASIQGPHQHYRRKDDGYRVGFGWLNDHKPDEYVMLHHKFVLDVIDKVSRDGLVDRQRVFLFGFSQACALNFRFAFTYPEVLRGIIGVCGGIPGDLDSNTRYRHFSAETFYLYGDDDEFYTQEQFATFNEKLSSMLANYQSRHYTAKHEITDEMRADMKKWLTDVI